MFPKRTAEKEILGRKIEKETKRLDGAVAGLQREVHTVKRHRAEMNHMFEDTLDAISKEYRK